MRKTIQNDDKNVLFIGKNNNLRYKNKNIPHFSIFKPHYSMLFYGR